MEHITISMPKQLAKHFLKLAESFKADLSNAGCNDFFVENTPDNRELIDLAEASNHNMPLEEYRVSDQYCEHTSKKGKLLTQDWMIFDLFVDQIKKLSP